MQQLDSVVVPLAFQRDTVDSDNLNTSLHTSAHGKCLVQPPSRPSSHLISQGKTAILVSHTPTKHVGDVDPRVSLLHRVVNATRNAKAQALALTVELNVKHHLEHGRRQQIIAQCRSQTHFIIVSIGWQARNLKHGHAVAATQHVDSLSVAQAVKGRAIHLQQLEGQGMDQQEKQSSFLVEVPKQLAHSLHPVPIQPACLTWGSVPHRQTAYDHLGLPALA